MDKPKTTKEMLMSLANEYLSAQFSVQVLGDNDGCLIVAPYQSADGSNVELYVAREGDDFIISDAGETLNQLFVSGITVEGKSNLLQGVKLLADTNGVSFSDSVLSISAPLDTFGLAAYSLATTIVGVSYFVRALVWHTIDKEVLAAAVYLLTKNSELYHRLANDSSQ